jgi:predicted transcriptional regulator
VKSVLEIKLNQMIDQYEFERDIYGVLAFGDETEIAKRLGKSVGLISQYLDPNNDRESPLLKAARMLAALADIDPIRGREALELFNMYVHRSMPVIDARPLDETRPKAYKEVNDFFLAEAQGKPLAIRIKECHDLIHANTALLASLYRENEAERNGHSNGNGLAFRRAK